MLEPMLTLSKWKMNIKWPKVISNKKQYEKTKQEPWSINIKIRAFNWLGYLLRLDSARPARKALDA